MFHLHDEIYWCKTCSNNTSYEMMITYVYFAGTNSQSNITLHQLKTLLKTSQEFRHFVIAICNDFYKFNKYNYDFIFLQIDSKIILTLVHIDNNSIASLLHDDAFEDKQNYLINFEKWKHKIIE